MTDTDPDKHPDESTPSLRKGSPDRQPTQAELDAIDLAEIESGRSSKDRDAIRREDDPGSPPQALYQAWLLWIGSAIAAAIGLVYGFVNMGKIEDLLKPRLAEGVDKADELDRVQSIAGWVAPSFMIVAIIMMAIQYPLLVAASRHHSRNCRNFYAAIVIAMLLCIPIGIDLLFSYDSQWSGIQVIGWVQFALLLLSLLFTFRRSVNQWLPKSTRIRPTQMFGSKQYRRNLG